MALKSEIVSTQWTFDVDNPGKLVQGVDNIKQCVLLIITTQKGSDPLRPDFGCGVYDEIDKPVNEAVPRIIKAVIDALTKYEPRIEKIKVTQQLDVSHFTFTVSYQIKDTVINDQLEITYGNTSDS